MKCDDCGFDPASSTYDTGTWVCYRCFVARNRRRDEATVKVRNVSDADLLSERAATINVQTALIFKLERELKEAKLEYLRKGVELAKTHMLPHIQVLREEYGEHRYQNWDARLDLELMKLEEELT